MSEKLIDETISIILVFVAITVIGLTLIVVRSGIESNGGYDKYQDTRFQAEEVYCGNTHTHMYIITDTDNGSEYLYSRRGGFVKLESSNE